MNKLAGTIIEIIIETNDKTGGALGAITNKLLAFDKSVQRTKNRLKELAVDSYSASIRLIDKVTPEGSKINSFLKGISTKAHFATIGLIDKTAGGIRTLEAKLLSLTGKAYNITMGLKDNASKGIKNVADSALTYFVNTLK